MAVTDVVVSRHDGVDVVRDDLLIGGSKRRYAVELFESIDKSEFVYPGTAHGYAIVALAIAARETGKKSIIFLAERKTTTEIIDECQDEGGSHVELRWVKMGFLRNVIRAVDKYVADDPNNRERVELGLRHPISIAGIARTARSLAKRYDACFSACSSGTLQAGLQAAKIAKKYYAVGTGLKNPSHGKSVLIEHYLKQKFEHNTKVPPPFPTFLNYDGKVWQYVLKYKQKFPKKRVLFWNVGAPRSQREKFETTPIG